MKYILQKFDNGMHYIIISPQIVTEITQNSNNRVICNLNDKINFHCAILPKKEGGHFINIGTNICKKLKLTTGDVVVATFEVDKSDYQFEMPEEFKEVLLTDVEASNAFHCLTAGNQRSLIYMVTLVKSSDKRIERALKIAEKIKNGITNPKIILK
jgi:alpha-L-arabinofuranosidase